MPSKKKAVKKKAKGGKPKVKDLKPKKDPKGGGVYIAVKDIDSGPTISRR